MSYDAIALDPQPGVWDGLDPETGKILSTLTMPKMITWHCYQLNATDRYWTGNRPYYFVDWRTGKLEGRFGVVRPTCSSKGHFAAQGLFFANGGLGCACIRTVMAGNAAFSADGATWDGAVPKEEHPVEGGPGKAEGGAPPAADDWPMYRCDMTRSAAAKTAVPDGLTVLWERKTVKPCASAGSSVAYDWPGNTPNDSVIAQPAVAGGRVFVSLTGSKQVLALEAKTGKVEWTFHLPARTDVPPTIHKGLALVGCHDGWVYAFRADSGERVWRTRAAPAERRMVAYGQLESTWPVVGGVLVVGDTAYALAGRTTEADGGLYLSALEPATGRVLWTRRRYLNNPGNIGVADSARYEELGTGASDVLGSDGKVVQFGRRETRKGGFKCDTGDDAGGYGAALRFGFDAVPVAVIGKELFIGQKKSGSDKKANIGRKGGWTLPVEAGSPVALAAAGERLIAGVSAGVEAGAKGELWVLSAADGKKLAAYPLPAAPACDGIAVANGRIYVSLTDGRVVCFGK